MKVKTSIEEVIECVEAYEKEYPGVLLLDSKSLVSIDYMANENAAILDGRWLKLLNGKMLKFVLWYDNEWGYAKRTYNIIKFILK